MSDIEEEVTRALRDAADLARHSARPVPPPSAVRAAAERAARRRVVAGVVATVAVIGIGCTVPALLTDDGRTTPAPPAGGVGPSAPVPSVPIPQPIRTSEEPLPHQPEPTRSGNATPGSADASPPGTPVSGAPAPATTVPESPTSETSVPKTTTPPTSTSGTLVPENLNQPSVHGPTPNP
ncbi:hypothetical protein [Streptomyces zagrosensis]|uniref:Uncharacterized protein n=1 Tax=Streptomyces zagrosensis TaxID=1042984 RepID=A0A7W9Q3U4_9ACTN|nr:hypothetical protein [Streptomyces zagrosensis]MBB5933095.1 hypothetical protein [Streptomyces zagrosensis]